MPCEVKAQLLVLYGSQRGQAQSIAEEICEQAGGHGFGVNVCCLSQKERYNLEKVTVPAVFVVSTTGDGEPPDTALEFVKAIQDKTLPGNCFGHLQYALLALGNTNYANFCNCGKTIDRRLQELGAHRFYATGHADDGVGLEIVVDPWIEGLWDAVKKAAAEMASGNPEPTTPSPNPEQALNIDLLRVSDPSPAVPDVCETPSARQEVQGSAASLVCSLSPLSGAALNVPAPPAAYIDVRLQESEAVQKEGPWATDGVFQVPVVTAVQLTREDAVKKALLLELDISEHSLSYQPGDSFSVLCPNNVAEVEELIHRLGLTDKHHLGLQLQLHTRTKKKTAQIPTYIPENITLQYLLTWCLEIRSVPKKAFLRALADCTSHAAEKRRLLELCSKQGAADYIRFVREPSVCLLDLLCAFPSCSPPLSLLIEHLPKLQPRPYSAASSSLSSPGKLRFVFNVVELPAGPERPVSRRGVCTGWMSSLVSHVLQLPNHTQMASAGARPPDQPKVWISPRPNSSFNPPADPAVPLVMVGPGTGVAPFIGFLQHREKQREENPDCVFGETWLFFGCRHKERDFLFQEELERFVASGTLTHLKVSFSRDSPEGPKYVQHNLHLHAQSIAELLLHHHGCFYVCGDAKNMAKDVNETLIDMVGKELQVDKLEAMKRVAVLKEEKRYLQDVWS